MLIQVYCPPTTIIPKPNNMIINIVGIVGASRSTIHLHGEATAIHSNRRIGIYAQGSGKVIIHLPSHHNTSYNNGQEDRRARGGGLVLPIYCIVKNTLYSCTKMT